MKQTICGLGCLLSRFVDHTQLDAHRQTDRETERQTERETDRERETERQTERQTDGQAGRQAGRSPLNLWVYLIKNFDLRFVEVMSVY